MVPELPPYVGPRPFKREDEPFFFGRDREGNDLVSLIISHSEVLLYAQSGAGKTSLINAKLWTLLENEDLEVLPLARVQGPPSLPKSTIKNIYVFNTLVKWAPKTASAGELPGMTLCEFLKRREQPIDKEGLPKPCVAIFDQFEELFTSYPECWEQRRDFFMQVRDALDTNSRMRVLFAMREDYVAAMDQYAPIMPEKFRVRFHLENLRKQQAKEAVEGPLALSKNRHFAEGVAEKLVQELMTVQVQTAGGQTEAITGEFVEPVQLQVVCDRIWRDLKPEDTEITLAHLETISVEKALLSFYEESIEDVARETGIDKSALRSWFEQKLVTPAGTRGMVFRGETETAGMRNDAVDALDKLHLIRIEVRHGQRWYELAHDRFVDAIQASYQRVLLSLEAGAEETRSQLEAKASVWVKLGRKKSELLRDDELHKAQGWLNSPAAKALGSSEAVRGLVEASHAEIQARSARRRKALVFVLGAACFITMVMAVVAATQRQRAIEESVKAKQQLQEVRRLQTQLQVSVDVFQPMDGGIQLAREEILGRNTWNLWSGGNEHFWNQIAQASFGSMDLLKMLDNRKYPRGERFLRTGLINQPGFGAAIEPDEYGLWLDKQIEPEPAEIDQKTYGKPSGVLGFRLFPNPEFNDDARKKWDGNRFINDPTYYRDNKLVRPYLVGVSCGACHIGPNPTNPPPDPENPRWLNLASAIGNQYIKEGKVFACNVDFTRN
jgi:hypothetical protein